ncbi:hypothetical protein BEH94_02850 [Candidatus Altiarchaeales archaeon WOR_SM1_SCG]|nr:hypothetical protein BEH94_02850 [Candidatus Altiarchaeales archaeon WOR_SM1_SCG]
MTNVEDFMGDLRTEIRETQERRAAYIRQKFTYVIGLLGIGNISIGNFQPLPLLYLAPLIAFAFDLYILGEDFGIKRAGGFLGRESSNASNEVKEWEKRCRENRDQFSKIACPFLSVLVLIVSIVVLWPQDKNNILYWFWIATNILILIGIWAYSYILNKKVQKFEAKNSS